MVDRIKRWALEALSPSPKQAGLEPSVSKSGAVEFDVSAFQRTAAGVEQLRRVRQLSESLKLKRTAE
jgi:hypothetical protein